MSKTDTIAFIGGGNMARSLIGGLIAGGCPAANIRVAEPVAELRAALERDFNIRTYADSAAAVFVPLQLPQPAHATPPDIRIELRRGATSVTVSWPAEAAAECAAWMRELLR